METQKVTATGGVKNVQGEKALKGGGLFQSLHQDLVAPRASPSAPTPSSQMLSSSLPYKRRKVSSLEKLNKEPLDLGLLGSEE